MEILPFDSPNLCFVETNWQERRNCVYDEYPSILVTGISPLHIEYWCKPTIQTPPESNNKKG